MHCLLGIVVIYRNASNEEIRPITQKLKTKYVLGQMRKQPSHDELFDITVYRTDDFDGVYKLEWNIGWCITLGNPNELGLIGQALRKSLGEACTWEVLIRCVSFPNPIHVDNFKL